jgi:hypothetical protein
MDCYTNTPPPRQRNKKCDPYFGGGRGPPEIEVLKEIWKSMQNAYPSKECAGVAFN